MCDRCALLDYPVADCWRPCYVPPLRGRTVPPPGLIWNELHWTPPRLRLLTDVMPPATVQP